jgi:cytochrome c553
MKQFTFLLLLLAGVPAAALAQQQQGGSNNGAQIANQGAGNGVAACASCHGAKGEGNAGANFPRLAGQSQAYLAKQLASYANGSRNNPIMMPIAKGLSPEQIQAVSAYYAGLNAPAAKAAAPAAPVAKRGEQLANVGDNGLGVQGCANCHGPGGMGEPPVYPYLSGQHASYLTQALGEWKSGARNTDPSMQMNMIAKRLSDADISALASYYAAQPAPPPASQLTNMAAGTPQRPAATGTSGQPAGGTAASGAGVEQGEPTSGGAQGIGGGGAASGTGPQGSKPSK